MIREGGLEAYRWEIDIQIQSLFVGKSAELTGNRVINGNTRMRSLIIYKRKNHSSHGQM